MPIISGKALVAQGGGPTAVINQSLAGVVLESRKFSEIFKIYGARFGVRGIIDEDFLDLTESTTHNLEQIANTPGSALGSTRDKPDKKYCHQMFEVMRAHDIRYFYYIGGNDSADTCRIVNDEAKAANYELRVIHVPKTIDNDILVTDHCPGFGSAAKFVAQAFAGANLDNLTLPGVYIGVVMGRNAGFLTAASILAKKFPDDGPHLVYVPERIFSVEKFLTDVEKIYKERGRCVIAASEGLKDEIGEPVVAKLQKQKECDAHGNITLSGNTALGDLLAEAIKEKLKIKRVRADTFGYVQRVFPSCVSEIDRREAREVGEKAVQFSVWHNVDGSVVIKRIGDYAVKYELVSLEEVAKNTKKMPEEFILGDNMISEAFKIYARPLVGEMELIDRLAAPGVKKIHKI